jgi:hypothetical protein
MTARAVLDSCRRSFVLVRRDADTLVLAPVFPDEHPIPDALFDRRSP